MTVTEPARRPSVAARRTGYLVAAAIHAVLLYLVNIHPGWAAIPVLTPDAARVIGLLNLSLVLGLVVNLVYAVYDPRWLTALGSVATTGVGLAVLVWIWRVFPFAFDDASVHWPLVVRVVLGVAIAGSAIGVAVQCVTLVRAVYDRVRRAPKSSAYRSR
jgi:hypothetical protein